MRTRGLKDDTTCIVVDIIPPDYSVPPSPPPKKQNKFRSFIFRKRSCDSANKLAKKLSSVGIVEELFEEGSAMLAERLVLFLSLVLVTVLIFRELILVLGFSSFFFICIYI